jgi:hypothetical protein
MPGRDRPVVGEVRGERLDELPDPIVDTGQDAGLQPIVADGYLAGELALHQHLRVRMPDGEAREFCVACQAAASSGEQPSDLHVGAGSAVGVVDDDVVAGQARIEVAKRRVDDLVLIGVAELGQKREEMALSVVPSVVWLRRLDSCAVRGGELAQTLLDLRIGFGTGFVADGERRLARGASAVEDGELPDEVVERGAGVLREVSDDGAEPQRRLLTDAEVDYVLSRVGIEIGTDFVGFGREESGDLVIEHVQVLVCSVELGAGVVE